MINPPTAITLKVDLAEGVVVILTLHSLVWKQVISDFLVLQ